MDKQLAFPLPLLTPSGFLEFLFLMVLFLLWGSLLERKSSFYRSGEAGAASSRFSILDGLRGFLALSVFLHHAVLSRNYYAGAPWELSSSLPFYRNAAELSVSFFFMITAFLFWGKALATPTDLTWKKLIPSRIRRLIPLYVSSLAMVFLIVFLITGLRLRVPLSTMAFDIANWLMCGMLTFPPRTPVFNGFQETFAIHSVIWTLAIEWQFYLLLPLLVRLPFATLLTAASCLALPLITPAHPAIKAFAFGIAAAFLQHQFKDAAWFQALRKKYLVAKNIGAASLLALILFLFDSTVDTGPLFLAFLVFLLFILDSDLFGLLRLPGARFLGTISYSLYLLHNMTLFVFFSALKKQMAVETLSAGGWIVLTAACGVTVVFLCACTYRFIEHPWLRKRATASPD